MRKIKTGDLIVDERPLMVMSLSSMGLPVAPLNGLTQEEKYKYLLAQSKDVDTSSSSLLRWRTDRQTSSQVEGALNRPSHNFSDGRRVNQRDKNSD
ncbi:uncharacterized protein BT62DRAFT_1008681 [Guyanagaster necrorhizus]|uniref:Uncharacterized protein n=1 Tax=Guyanagaster necrorhizus TaxID=856835 RepID=A0A9P7VP20_9AGAR|nr:uncharacterized protein BT62DRAFT_1008681 [Guyanagaster necrorhizus MCA 3950]KAG7443997.1 hypothetical protein BT62DRAFT_1008681 [Guyanagaster necrorhizus MCA 3950]